MDKEKKKLGVLDVKQAFLSDLRFREMFPELKEEMKKALDNPTCACNRSLYDKFFTFPDRLQKYFPNKQVESLKEAISNLAKNNFSVINCHVNELNGIMKKLPPGRKQIACARYEDQITVIINELDVVF